MTDTNTQAAVDAVDATAQPVATTNNAQNTGDDLDTLLSQFEAQTRVEPATPQTQQTQQPQPVPVDPDRLKRVEERLFNEDLNKTVSNIRGDLKVPDRMAKGWLDQIARERPAIAQAFLQKESNPDNWKRIEQSLAKEFAKEVKSVTFDTEVTEDRNAVTAAVRGASTPAPAEKAPDFGTMSNAELRAEYRKYGINPTF